VTYHDTLWKIRLCNDDRTHLLQQGYQNAVLYCWLERSSDITECAVISLNVELILESHRHPMQRPHHAAVIFEESIKIFRLLQGIIKEDLGKAESTLIKSLAIGAWRATCQFVCAEGSAKCNSGTGTRQWRFACVRVCELRLPGSVA
jgi:hypothetical protein